MKGVRIPMRCSDDRAQAAAEVRAAVAHTRFHDVRWLVETGSTNEDVLAAAAAGAAEGLVVVADHQRAGRGRRDRQWDDVPGASLLFSVLVRPRLEADAIGWIVAAAGLAASDAAAELGVDVGLKWPNDLVAHDAGHERKLAGLLAESVLDAGGVRAVVVGVGYNVGARPPDQPGATSLHDLLGVPVQPNAVLILFLRALDQWLATLQRQGPPAIRSACLGRSTTVGRAVRIELDTGSITGTAVDLAPGGQLLVDDGTAIHMVAVGDVVHLRPSGSTAD